MGQEMIEIDWAEEGCVKPGFRRLNRIAAMQYLYMHDVNRPDDRNQSLHAFFEGRTEGRDYYAFAEQLVHGVLDHLDAVDEHIERHATNWEFSRIAKVDLAILRVSIYELYYREDIPPIVTINEAVDLSKMFSEYDSKRFINGILDRIRGDLKRPDREPYHQ
mgnify:CR=1 FL=1